MRKLPLFLLLFSLFFSLKSQDTDLYKTWVGEELEILDIGKKWAKYSYDVDLIQQYLVSIEEESILVLTYEHWRSGKSELDTTELVFDILRLTEDTLILAPLNYKAWRALLKKEAYLFVSKTSLYDSTFQFSNIHIRSYPEGKELLPRIEMEIDSSGLFCFHTSQRMGILKGTYFTQLPDELFSELLGLLRTAPLSHLPEQFGSVTAKETYEFIFEFEHTSRTATGNIFPLLYRPLLDFLLSLHEKIDWEKN